MKDKGLNSVLDEGLRIKDERLNSTDSEGAAWRLHLLENSETNVTSPSSCVLHPASQISLLSCVLSPSSAHQ
ncbi:MAG: hypothetical protein ACI30J_02665 [Paludibacteraceae bacterium]